MNDIFTSESEVAPAPDKHPVFCITPLSKYLALILFIILPFLGGYVGYQVASEKVVEVEKNEVIKKKSIPVEPQNELSLNYILRDPKVEFYQVGETDTQGTRPVSSALFVVDTPTLTNKFIKVFENLECSLQPIRSDLLSWNSDLTKYVNDLSDVQETYSCLWGGGGYEVYVVYTSETFGVYASEVTECGVVTDCDPVSPVQILFSGPILVNNETKYNDFEYQQMSSLDILRDLPSTDCSGNQLISDQLAVFDPDIDILTSDSLWGCSKIAFTGTPNDERSTSVIAITKPCGGCADFFLLDNVGNMIIKKLEDFPYFSGVLYQFEDVPDRYFGLSRSEFYEYDLERGNKIVLYQLADKDESFLWCEHGCSADLQANTDWVNKKLYLDVRVINTSYSYEQLLKTARREKIEVAF